MMLIERYALSCGIPIGKPYVYEKYFPLPIDKYITIHPFTKPAKTYDYWQDVVDELLPLLEPLGIRIVQIGAKNEPKLLGCVHLQGTTSVSQVSFILGGSMLHLSADTFSAHIASSKSLPMVTIFSSSYVSNCCGYWGDKSKQVFLSPNFTDGKKPSFSNEESPKSINTIPSETISQSVLKLLSIGGTIPYRTVHVGSKYTNGIYFHNIVPTSGAEPIEQDGIEVRMDLGFNEEFLVKQLSRRVCAVITDRPINMDIVRDYKPRISVMFVFVKDTSSLSFVKQLISMGINVEVVTYESREKELSELRLSYYEHKRLGVLAEPDKDRVLKLETSENLFFKSNKIYTCGGKKFFSLVRSDSDLKIRGRSTDAPNKFLSMPKGLVDYRDLDFFKIVEKVA